MPDESNNATILDEQIAYYRARAGEYDEWFYRTGRYDHGEEINTQFLTEAAQVRAALHTLEPVDHALELACGTGIWTLELVKLAKHVTALDASPEVIAINRAKLAEVGATATFKEVDLFTWEPDQQYDLVFFAFWLSHVPPERLAPFLAKVAQATKPGGRAFMVDSRRSPVSGVPGRTLPKDDTNIVTRELNDGRTFDVVKIFYEPDDLATQFVAAGFEVTVSTTEQFFIYADGQRT